MILNSGYYEEAESAFMLAVLRDGMIVMDIGANLGYYALLASHKIGRRGRVIAFEPSERELRFLRANLLMNRCRNVTVEPIALGSASGTADLYVVEDYWTGSNCLRSREDQHSGHTTKVALRTLDDYVTAERIDAVDLLKMDIEGGELEVIRGAHKFLQRLPRPIIVCELIDELTRRWGYEPIELIDYLSELDFTWFCMSAQGALHPLRPTPMTFDGNFVAVPKERLEDFRRSGLVG